MQPDPAKSLFPRNPCPQIPLYAAAGFSMVGLSSVEHGQDPWFEMRQTLTSQ